MNDFTQCFATLFVGVINHLSCYDVDSCVTTFLVEVMSMLSFYPNWYKPSTDYHFFFFLNTIDPIMQVTGMISKRYK